jgi:hypothetical protein
MARAKTVQQLVIRLDSLVALESNLLNRHACLPAARRQEWLRGLLMQGFRDECRALMDTSDNGPRRPRLAFTRRVSRKTPPPVTTRDPALMARTEDAPMPDAAGKPFAALGRVIG